MMMKFDGKKMFFFFFNKGYNNGVGNLFNLGGYKIVYLWWEIFMW